MPLPQGLRPRARPFGPRASGHLASPLTRNRFGRFQHEGLDRRLYVKIVAADVCTCAWAWNGLGVQYDAARTGCQRSRSGGVEPTRANTTQAFLLGEYLSSPRPDVLLVFSNTHDAMPLSRLARDVDQLARLVDELVPATTTRLVWASRHAEDERKKPAAWRHRRYPQARTSPVVQGRI